MSYYSMVCAQIRVAAINRVGQGSWSADGLLQTAPAPPTPPSSVQAEAMGPKEIGAYLRNARGWLGL
eukprot:1160072-Pelagomonas_calceolata.AAC.1